MSKSVYYHGGTLVLRDVDAGERPPAPFKLIRERWRCEGYHYGSIQPYLQEQDVRDAVPRWQPLNLHLQEMREPHDYQVEALAAWDQAERRGSIVLPTGAGKTFVAIQAISRVNRSTVVVAPTIDLLHHSLENRYYRKKRKERPPHLPFCMVIKLFSLERSIRAKNGIIVAFS
jgi:Type III restriction enzyme, res subunit